MSIVSMPLSRALPELEFEHISDLAVTLSNRLTRAIPEDLTPLIGEVLEQIGAATRVAPWQLIEFTQSGSVGRAHAPTSLVSASGAPCQLPVLEDWLVERLARGEPVAIARPEDLPREAIDARERARRIGPCSTLGAPASVGGQVLCALVFDDARSSRRWAPPLIERLQLLSEILGATLQRSRQEHTLRSKVAVIERLNSRLEADNVYLKEELKSYHDFDDIVGESTALRLALSRLAQVAPMNASVLLLGETGTGKELFARALHERSPRRVRPLVRVNCAALPPTLVESELFGHEKGAFTGAVGMRQGRFELADGGTIFLDEIGDLSPEVQVKFLRVLQEGEFERVGSSHTRRVDVRVIAATHRDLEAAVTAGTFRADLYYRLSVYPIRLPSLRERREDIPRLVWFFIHRHQRDLGRHITKVPQSVVDVLQRHSWPGNIRELENVIERALIASGGDLLQLDEPIAFTRASVPSREATDNLDGVQRAHIQSVLEQVGWRLNGIGNAAERLGIHPNTLRFRMKKLGLVRPERQRQSPRRANTAGRRRPSVA